MKDLRPLLKELEDTIEHHTVLRPEVSSGAVGWHIEHCLLVIDVSIAALQKSDPAAYKWSFNFWRVLLFLLGWFPRGRARSPKAVQPKQSMEAPLLQEHLQLTRERLNLLGSLGKDQFMKHPYFGLLDLAATGRFLELHTKHHLKIIRDILRS
ncbi:MAG TPA: DinB family protein [Phnomibacter sp.]|nr:DinB family protein [Phnomibacter sp.]